MKLKAAIEITHRRTVIAHGRDRELEALPLGGEGYRVVGAGSLFPRGEIGAQVEPQGVEICLGVRVLITGGVRREP